MFFGRVYKLPAEDIGHQQDRRTVLGISTREETPEDPFGTDGSQCLERMMPMWNDLPLCFTSISESPKEDRTYISFFEKNFKVTQDGLEHRGAFLCSGATAQLREGATARHAPGALPPEAGAAGGFGRDGPGGAQLRLCGGDHGSGWVVVGCIWRLVLALKTQLWQFVVSSSQSFSTERRGN